MGYVIVCILAFALGALVARICTYVRTIRKMEKDEVTDGLTDPG